MQQALKRNWQHCGHKMLDKVEENCGKCANEVLADSGYQSDANLLAAESKGSTPYIASGQGESFHEITGIEQVSTNGIPHEYFCPAGMFKGTSRDAHAQIVSVVKSKSGKALNKTFPWPKPILGSLVSEVRFTQVIDGSPIPLSAFTHSRKRAPVWWNDSRGC